MACSKVIFWLSIENEATIMCLNIEAGRLRDGRMEIRTVLIPLWVKWGKLPSAEHSFKAFVGKDFQLHK
jgi:hypothetical protein